VAPFAADSFGSAKFVELGTVQKVPSSRIFLRSRWNPKPKWRLTTLSSSASI